MHRIGRVAVPLVALLALVGCSAAPTTTSTTTSAAPTSVAPAAPVVTLPAPGSSVVPSDFVQTLRTGLESVSTLTTTIDATVTVGGQSVTMASEAVTDRSNPNEVKTALTTTVQGVTSEVIFDGHYYYARQPSGDWIKTDATAAAGASAPSNPGDLDAAYRSYEKSFKSVTYVGQQTIDGVETAHYTVEADMAALGGTDSESEQSMTMDVYLDAQKRPVRLEQKSDATQVTLVQGKFNEPVTITIPADAKEA